MELSQAYFITCTSQLLCFHESVSQDSSFSLSSCTVFISLQLNPYVLLLALSKNTDWCWKSEWVCPYIHPRSMCTVSEAGEAEKPRTLLPLCFPLRTQCLAPAPRKELLPQHPPGFLENLAKFCAHGTCVRRGSKFTSTSQRCLWLKDWDLYSGHTCIPFSGAATFSLLWGVGVGS